MKTIYKVGNLEFTSKAKSRDYARTQLTNNNNKTITKEDDLFFYLMDLVELHPDKKDKIGKGVKSFKIQNDYDGNISMNINQIDNNEPVSFSWYNTSGFVKVNPKTILSHAFRFCIDNQIKEFKNSTQDLKCYLCSSSKLLEVDHIIQFKKIQEDFLKITTQKIPITFDKEILTNRTKFKKEDKKLNDEFYNYHLENAKLRILCRTCNRKRKKK